MIKSVIRIYWHHRHASSIKTWTDDDNAKNGYDTFSIKKDMTAVALGLKPRT